MKNHVPSLPSVFNVELSDCCNQRSNLKSSATAEMCPSEKKLELSKFNKNSKNYSNQQRALKTAKIYIMKSSFYILATNAPPPFK